LKLRGYILDVLMYIFICVSGRGPGTARQTHITPTLTCLPPRAQKFPSPSHITI
jgi:hypothetical protein